MHPGGPTPEGRSNGAAVVTSMNTMLIFGGRTDTGVVNTMLKLDLVTDNWISVSPSGTPPRAQEGIQPYQILMFNESKESVELLLHPTRSLSSQVQCDFLAV